MTNLVPASCCCGGGCDTGCECPDTATLPSTVLASFIFTDCCGISRSASVTVPILPAFTAGCPSCLICPIYSYKPDLVGVGCGQGICDGDLIAWGCGSAGDCTTTEAIIGQVSLASDTCIYEPDAGNCDQWVLTVTVTAREQTVVPPYLVGPVPMNLDAYCRCGWSNLCNFSADCFVGAWTVCKSDGFADPRGTYTSCVGLPTEFCDYTAAECPGGSTAPAPTVVVS